MVFVPMVTYKCPAPVHADLMLLRLQADGRSDTRIVFYLTGKDPKWGAQRAWNEGLEKDAGGVGVSEGTSGGNLE